MSKISSALVCLLFSGMLFLSCMESQQKEDEKLKFNKQRWAIHWKEHQGGENIRPQMLDDLLKNHLKVGMDSMVIKDLLGEPERDFGFSYNLGYYESGFDPTFLILDFDKSGKLLYIKTETI